jgi:hypothetical protein
MTNRHNIEKYCSYFERQLNQIQKLADRLHKKVLLFVILDTLGRARYPTVEKHKPRFINLVRDHIQWKDNSRISLYRILLISQSQKSSELTKFAQASIEKWNDWELPDIGADPLMEQIQHLATNDQERRLIADSTHLNLFYAYRNHLIHEFREPGAGMEMDQLDSCPYYHRMTHRSSNGDDERETWELVYPLGFFVTLATSCLIKLKYHLLENDLNPYSFYKFGTLWQVRI